ncbi:transglycosylase domain-containing protein [Labrys wisconsinensis]|uniref:peptidoglycan glycosyltransferase n=1 Tax=Labrys wisconsinensis TaxID=425677 RepID=A0ABU0JDY5_9HYPH|nr:PBP1A family penicillin-binding protein [Labrys wisconsinensis]MDQ0472493.1 penicillin-binding protein 1A [Labrys wisconsinensis]
MADGRREPRFDSDRGDFDMRVTRDDRSAPASAAEMAARSGTRPSDSPRRQDGRRRSFSGGVVDGTSPGGRPPRRRRRRSFLGRLFYWGFVLAIWGVIGAGGVVAWYASHLPPIQDLAVPQRPPNVQILASDGTPIANRGGMGGAAVSIKDLPPYVPAAFVAIEDRRFYSHWGIDPLGLIRAVTRNLVTGHVEQGGSTLTQQLAKNVFLTQERSLERKVQEAILALWLERKYSKDQILEMYLNRVYFGAGAFGVEAAAQRYFGRPASKLTLAQAAMLAGLVKAPSKLAPNKNLQGAQDRAEVVLGAMADMGVISAGEEKAAIAKPAVASSKVDNFSGNYPADWVTSLLDDYVGPLESDVVVETTINSRLQVTAEQALTQALDKNGGRLNVGQGALVAMEPDGAVRALVGGRSYAASQFNRVISARRQPGSTFKPFVYLAALEAGLTPDTVRDDAPVSLAGWRPEDFSKEYRGPVTLATALALSLNTVAVRLCAELGPKAVVAMAQRLGIASKLDPNPSIALGTSEVTPLELTSAYAVFANGGRTIVPYVVTEVKAVSGKVLYKRSPPPMPQVISDAEVGMMNAMMSQTLTIGTARKAALPGWQAAGKSGTSQNYRDAWFVGFTSRMVTAVWLGNDDGASTRRITGGSLPASIWNSFMVAAHKGLQPQPLPGRPWVPPPPQDVAPVVAAQPQVDGAPDDQPVAMAPAPAGNGEWEPPQGGPNLGDWIKHVLGQ